VDAGANISLASVFLSRVFPQATCQLIEASSQNLSVAKLNVEGHPQMNVLHRARWHEKAKLDLVSSKDFSTIRVKSELRNNNNQEAVETITMGDVVASHGSDLFILKMDIEGAEKFVLSKNNDWLTSWPIILIEPRDEIIPDNESLAGLLSIKAYQQANIIKKRIELIFVPRCYIGENNEGGVG